MRQVTAQQGAHYAGQHGGREAVINRLVEENRALCIENAELRKLLNSAVLVDKTSGLVITVDAGI